MMNLSVLTMITGALILASCNKTDVTPIQNPDELSFSKSIQPIASSKCMDCHDANTELPLNHSSNWVLLDQQGKLKPAIFEGKHVYMETPLDSQEKTIIQNWIEAGYPE